MKLSVSESRLYPRPCAGLIVFQFVQEILGPVQQVLQAVCVETVQVHGGEAADVFHGEGFISFCADAAEGQRDGHEAMGSRAREHREGGLSGQPGGGDPGGDPEGRGTVRQEGKTVKLQTMLPFGAAF